MFFHKTLYDGLKIVLLRLIVFGLISDHNPNLVGTELPIRNLSPLAFISIRIDKSINFVISKMGNHVIYA